jgi:hypothetical protein
LRSNEPGTLLVSDDKKQGHSPTTTPTATKEFPGSTEVYEEKRGLFES